MVVCTNLRIKEVFESAEAFKLIESFLNAVTKHQTVDTIFDMACGHGFVGEDLYEPLSPDVQTHNDDWCSVCFQAVLRARVHLSPCCHNFMLTTRQSPRATSYKIITKYVEAPVANPNYR